MSRSVTRILFPLLALVLLGQGCFGAPQAPTGPDGGIYKTADRGATWSQKRVLIEGARGISIADQAITTLVFDPQDRNTIYAGTEERGLLMTLDGGDSWTPARTLLSGRIDAVAVDPKDKCNVYASQGNKIYKTGNCGRDWAQAWFDPKTDKRFTQITVDWFNPTMVWAGSSEGDILKSTDAGRNWLVSQRANAAITSIVIHPKDSRVVYAASRGDGLWKTLDGGNTWRNIKSQLSSFDNARRATQVAIDALSPDAVYLVSPYGILKSPDGGESWGALPLTSPSGSVDIRSLALNPRNSQELQYITPNTLLVSSDGGNTWQAQKLPSTRIANVLTVDPEDGKTLYLGMGAAAK